MFSCNCGRLTKDVSELNDVAKDLICLNCNSGLKDSSRSVSEQTKIDHYLDIKDDENADTIRRAIYSYLLKVEDATDSEIQKALGYKERNNVSPRRNELVGMGLVEERYQRHCMAKESNRKVTCWKAKS